MFLPCILQGYLYIQQRKVSAMTIKATIIFSTYNGAKTLPRMMDALCDMTLDQKFWKIVAMNNNSTDNTQQILESYIDKLPLEIHKETRQGKAFAIDAGFKYIEGDILILTDDDMRPAPNWIEAYLQEFEEHPEFDILGGTIKPDWEKEPPSWIKKYLDLGKLGVLYALNDDRPEGEVKPFLISGGNSAFRTNILKDKTYISNKKLGPSKDIAQFAMGDDILFCTTLVENGARAYRTHKPVIHHFIPKKYFDEKWMLSRAERYGLGIVIVRQASFKNRPMIFGRPIKTLIKFMIMSLLYFPILLLPKSKKRFNFLWEYNKTRGILKNIVV